MKYLKFEFIDRADMLTKLADYFTEEGEPQGCAVVEGIHTPSGKYAVDVLFFGTFPILAEEVTPIPSGLHTIAGQEHLYLERYNELNNL